VIPADVPPGPLLVDSDVFSYLYLGKGGDRTIASSFPLALVHPDI